MREIKFRAWDDGMVYDDRPGVILSRFTNVMQYTGLKDCEGNEIYEGDIIKHTATDIVGAPITCKYTVEFHEGCYLCGHRPLREVIKIFKGKKIGNIYEDKDLLDTEDEE